MKALLLLPLALPLMAAAPPRQLTLAMPGDATLSPSGGPATVPVPRFEPAPLPNRTLSGPATPRATADPTLAPTLFTTREQYRGDGFSRGSTAQSEQERNVKPPVGFSLRVPMNPQ